MNISVYAPGTNSAWKIGAIHKEHQLHKMMNMISMDFAPEVG